MGIVINNFIPAQQQCNQRWENILDILLNLPDIPTMNDTYAHIKLLVEVYKDIIRIDVINGIHKPIGDNYHFNIRVWDARNNFMIHDNLHVYVSPSPLHTDSYGNPTITWNINRFLQITD